MNDRNHQHTHQHQHQQKPALESDTAGGFHIVGRYRTQSGQLGVEIRISARSGRMSFTGKWGAGSGHSGEQMRSLLESMLEGRRGVVAELPFGGLDDGLPGLGGL